MKWTKRGLIFAPPTELDWMVTHAQNPFAEHIGVDLYRIHFAGRDQLNQARGGYIVIDINRPTEIQYLTREPTIDLGALGCFDDSGTMPSCIVSVGGLKYMYYTGWTQTRKVPFLFFIGLAISRDDGKTFQRYSRAPVLGRNFHDPYLTASPWVLIEGNLWRMWYVSGTGWEAPVGDAKLKHRYRIAYADSRDGITWNTSGTVCIDYEDEEYAIARPFVYRDDGLYKMWYCARGGTPSYRLGYAESPDGIVWARKDGEIGLDVSPVGWDSEMICYPFVFKHGGTDYMLYNGNDYGRTGIGYAGLDG